ncbi:hypothetical protein KMZ93_09955 [Bradyrhizobium sediminis]|uniref:Flagellar protein FlaG n=1 Tax=Bradyrhizobium sediminis TaxID=2840469 RepID=A0A975RZ72_9BRAD|nr:hypothetical protein [Bradyrhizobium sediminis]QWG25169.1 hypothetical protein KMZ93_09955 [Bradyrhizobium sediminis]
MSMDFNIKPVGAPVATPVAPPVSEAADHAVATELPASKSVTAADASVRARIGSDVANSSVSHQVVIDRAAASIVYQVVDEKTSLVVRQFPDEAILRRRAYFRTLDLTRGAPTRLLATDRKA